MLYFLNNKYLLFLWSSFIYEIYIGVDSDSTHFISKYLQWLMWKKYLAEPNSLHTKYANKMRDHTLENPKLTND